MGIGEWEWGVGVGSGEGEWGGGMGSGSGSGEWPLVLFMGFWEKIASLVKNLIYILLPKVFKFKGFINSKRKEGVVDGAWAAK